MRWELFGPCADAQSGEQPPALHKQCMRQFIDKTTGEVALRCSCYCHEWPEEETK